MAELKLTKGPWHAEEINEDSDSVRIFAGEDFLAVVGIWQKDKNITKANADLMAASPDLLKACLTALGDVSNVAIRGMVQAAIDKATGGNSAPSTNNSQNE